MPFRPDQMFIAKLGISYRADGDVVAGHFEVTDDMRVPGTRLVRAGLLATAADIVSGWGANAAVFPRIPLTVDLTVHRLAPFAGDALDVVSRLLKLGRTTTVAEVRFGEAALPDRGRPSTVVLSHVTFTVSPRPEDVFDDGFGETLGLPRPERAPSLASPILEDIGARVVAPGVAELDRVPYVMQPAGTIQGGAVALLAEQAAESRAGAPIRDLEIRYLSAVRVGPARAVAEVVSPGLLRVEVRDSGHADRLASLAMARL
jgi:acyl-coenzyme A thioesterase PaaI-like protein